MPYEAIDHTADVGIRVRAPELRLLFSEAAHAMFDLITDTAAVAARTEHELAVEGIDGTDLLINWLRELLFLFSGRNLLIRTVAIDTLTENRLTGRVYGEWFHPERHVIHTELKAVTYSGADVTQLPNGWETTLIFDV